MAEIDDYFKMKMLEKEGFTPYEQVKIGHMQSKKASGTAIGALVTAAGAAVVGVGGWFWAASQSKNAKDVAMAYINGADKRIEAISALLESETTRRINGDVTLNQTITDTISGQQSSQLTANQQASLDATQTVMTGLMTGQYSQNPIKVVRVSGQRECDCDTCGGCR